MADTTTTNLVLTKPEVTASNDTWGTKLNADMDIIDGLFTTGPALLLSKGGTSATTAAAARTNLGVAIGTNVQAWDADLDAIAAISGTSGLLRKSAANTWSLDTVSYAPLASPGLTGTPTAPTAAVDTNTTQLATTEYVIAQGYLKSATAASTYLTTASASSTYLTQTNASGTYLTIANAAATYSTPASVTTALAPYLTSATAAATYSTPASVTTALAPYATTSYVNSQIAANVPGGFTFLGTVATTSGTSQPLSVSLGSYSFISVVYNGVSGTNGATSTFQINGVTFATTASAGGTTTGTFWIELLQGYCTFSVQGTGGSPIAVGTNVPVTSGTSTLTFSVTVGSFDAGSISVYGVK